MRHRNINYKYHPLCSPPSIVSKATAKVIGHATRLRDVMGQSYPIHACCTRTNHARYSSVQVIYWGSGKHNLLK